MMIEKMIKNMMKQMMETMVEKMIEEMIEMITNKIKNMINKKKLKGVEGGMNKEQGAEGTGTYLSFFLMYELPWASMSFTGA